MLNTDTLEKALTKYMSGQLARFRADLESQGGHPISEVELNGALLLSDLCCFLGLDEQQYHHVMGQDGTQHVTRILDLRI